MTAAARKQLADAMKSVKRGRFAVAPKEERTIDGVTFASKREAARYATLKLMEQQGLISHLECQPEYKVTIQGKPFCRYRADFRYFERGERIIEDVKSSGTRRDEAYRLRKRAAELAFHMKVNEVCP